jgi:coatomer subunit beta
MPVCVVCSRPAAAGVVDDDFASRLKRVHQLSGFADPIYCEAYLTVHEYDIVLEILIINRTESTLTNVAVELATMGDLKIVERPQSFTLGPQDSRTIRANIKVRCRGAVCTAGACVVCVVL